MTHRLCWLPLPAALEAGLPPAATAARPHGQCRQQQVPRHGPRQNACCSTPRPRPRCGPSPRLPEAARGLLGAVTLAPRHGPGTALILINDGPPASVGQREQLAPHRAALAPHVCRVSAKETSLAADSSSGRRPCPKLFSPPLLLGADWSFQFSSQGNAICSWRSTGQLIKRSLIKKLIIIIINKTTNNPNSSYWERQTATSSFPR